MPLVPSRIIWWIVEAGHGVIARAVVTFAVELREESMAGDWLHVEAPLGLGGRSVLWFCDI